MSAEDASFGLADEAPLEQARRRQLFRRPLAVDARERAGQRDDGRADRQSVGRGGYLALKAELQERLLDVLGERDLGQLDDAEVTGAVEEFVGDVLANEELALNDEERTRLSDELVQEALGLGPLAPLLADPAVTDVLVNGPQAVYVERFGKLVKTGVQFRDDEHIERIIERLAIRVGRRIDRAWPMVDLRLPDGSRVNATIPPISIDGPTLSIRRFGRQRLTQQHLVRNGMLSPDMMSFLRVCVGTRQNMVISGGTGAGKSTLLGALAESIAPSDRIITIEDTAELVLDQEHVVRLESRPANIEGEGLITTRDLLINSLRMRPTRILIGEVRGAEALDMLQAMNTGHEGSLTTVHANSARDALSRLETMVLMAGIELPSRAIREQIVSAIHVVVHVDRCEDGVRRVRSISEVTGLEGSTPVMQEVFRFRTLGVDGGRISGRFVATGVVPRLFEELRERGGSDLDVALFRPSELADDGDGSEPGGAWR